MAARVFLSAASLFFYAYFKVDYLILILLSIFANFIFGNILSTKKIKHRKTFLWVGILLNLSVLAYYKYTNFFIDNMNAFFGTGIDIPRILLPLAISFFTFQQIAYLVDSYRQETKEYDFINYILFVTFFPQLIAGPIVHHKEMMPQFQSKRAKFINYDNISKGLYFFVLGLSKKVIIADYLATLVSAGFESPASLSFTQAWITSLSYTFQLYFDFSGYCDMAMGLALFFNIKLPINFNSPYKAVNIQDFWRRWHITLSRWLRDYLYIPLGGNRKGYLRTHLNVFLVFFLGGIWHGAGWTFIVWGALHGVAQVIYRIYQLHFSKIIPINKFFGWFITFNFINLAWVFFRADNIYIAIDIIEKMYTFNISTEIFLLGGLLSGCVFLKNVMEHQPKWSKLSAVLLGIILFYCLWIMILPTQKSPFLYFNF